MGAGMTSASAAALVILDTDPRAFSKEKLVAPAPLPVISRRALRKVRDRLPPPTACPYCGGPVELVANDLIYGRKYGRWPYAYLCEPCDAYVGLHPVTDLPLGTLADAETRKARKRAKEPFMRLVDARFAGDRVAAYAWLAEQLRIDPRLCHFAMFSADRCAAVLAVLAIERAAQPS